MDPLTNTLQREQLRENIERYRDRIIPFVRLSRGGVVPPSPLDRAAVMARREVIGFESCLRHLARTLAKIARAFPGTIMSEDDLVDFSPDLPDAVVPSRSLNFVSEYPLYRNHVNLLLTVEGAYAPQGLVQWRSGVFTQIIHYWAVQLRPEGEEVVESESSWRTQDEEKDLLEYLIENGKFQGVKAIPGPGPGDDDVEVPTGLCLEVQWRQLFSLGALSRTFQRGLRAGQGGARRERSADPRARRAPSLPQGAGRARSAER